jgi:hypothetical protein
MVEAVPLKAKHQPAKDVIRVGPQAKDRIDGGNAELPRPGSEHGIRGVKPGAHAAHGRRRVAVAVNPGGHAGSTGGQESAA